MYHDDVKVMSKLCRIFELKTHYSTQMKISNLEIRGGKYDLGNWEFLWFVNDK